MLSLLLALAAPEFTASPFYFFDLDENLTANVALADVDGDGDLDVLTANGRHWAQQDYVFINAGSGRLLEARRVGDGLTTGYALLPIDLDNDGDLDAVAVRDMVPSHLFENDGHGNFADLGPIEGSGGNARGAVVADVDGDGHDDLVIVRRGETDLLFRGTGGLGLEAGEDIAAPGTSTGVSVGDFDGDGDLDLAIARRDGDSSLLLVNDGAGAFEEAEIPGSGGDHRKVELADFDGDGKMDLLLAATDGALKIYLRQDGAFTLAQTLSQPSGQVQSLTIGDLDADGDIDILAGGTGANTAWINGGADGWSSIELPSDEATTYGMAIGDMNGDGKPDIVTANSGASNRVIRQR